ncbi:MAG: T9SS type A sorting domain-containing protein, partial [Bacteroidota bacterium]
TSNVSPDNYYKSFYWKKYVEPQLKNQVSPSTTQNNDSVLTVLGRWAWGPCVGIAARGNYIYIGNGALFQVLDVSNPYVPVISGEYLTEGMVEDVRLKDSLAYVCIGHGLLILNISDAGHPAAIGYIAMSGAVSVAVVDSFAYVRSGATWWMYIINITNPAYPFLVNKIDVGNGFPFSEPIAASGRTVFTIDGSTHMVMVSNVTDPYNVLPHWYGSSNAKSLYASDSLLFVGMGTKLHIARIDSPGSVFPISNLQIHTTITDLVSVDSLVYCTTEDSGIIIVDISNIQQPRKRGVYKPTIPPATIRDLEPQIISVFENSIYCSYANGVLSAKAETPDSLHLRSFFKTGGGRTYEMVIKDTYLFAAQGAAGLWILDISNLEHPHQISNVSIGGDIVDVIVEDSLMYLLGNYEFAYLEEDTTQGIWIVNIANPEQPKILSHYYGISKYVLRASPIQFAKSGKKIIVMHGTRGSFPGDSLLEIVDVSNPLEPTCISVFEKNFRGYRIAANDSIIFVATDDKGLMVINVNTVPPHQITSLFQDVRSVAIRDSFIFTCKQDSLYILNITNPYYPKRVASIFVDDEQTDIAFSQNFVYVAHGDIRVIDISNPAHPVEKAVLEQGETVFASNDLVVFDLALQGICIARNNLITSVLNENISTIPTVIQLSQNFPNPFNSTTQMRFTLSKAEKVTLKVFDTSGKEILTLLNNVLKEQGVYEISVDVSSLASGIYFYRLSSTKEFITKKMVIIK